MILYEHWLLYLCKKIKIKWLDLRPFTLLNHVSELNYESLINKIIFAPHHLGPNVPTNNNT